MRSRQWVLGVVAAMILAPLGLWSAAQAQSGRTLIIAMGADQTGMDPQTNLNAESGYVTAPIFDGIVNYKEGTADPGPGLAESWTVSSDGKVYTFKIRRGVTFHDGTPMTARTVAEDVDRVVNPQNPCYIFARKAVDSYAQFVWGSAATNTAAKVEAVDDATLRVTLPTPNAPFAANLGMPWSGIMSPAATKKYNCDASQHPVGTGPFKFVEAVRNDHVTLEANPSYWNGAPKLAQIVFRVVPESTTRLLMLERNDVQFLIDVPASDIPRISANPALKLYRRPGFYLNGMAMSNDVGPFKDKRVRQALNYAVDKDAINKALYGGWTTQTQGVPAFSWAYNKSVTAYAYDPAKARAMLREAGFPNGFTTNMMVADNPRPYNPIGFAKSGEAVQSYLAKVGVNAKITKYEWGAYLNQLRHTPWEGLAGCGWGADTGDPDNIMYSVFWYDDMAHVAPTNNCARYHNVEYDHLIFAAREIPDQAQRQALYQHANQILHDDAPWIFLNTGNLVRAARSNLNGYVLNPLGKFWYMQKVSFQ